MRIDGLCGGDGGGGGDDDGEIFRTRITFRRSWSRARHLAEIPRRLKPGAIPASVRSQDKLRWKLTVAFHFRDFGIAIFLPPESRSFKDSKSSHFRFCVSLRK
ncbi:hypothetical protein AKJ16_DCAP07943 [Drosera capensis]